MTANQLIKATETNLLTQAHKTLPEVTAAELHNALGAACMEALAPVWARKEAARAPKRQAFYLSMEYLTGRLVYNNLYCMGMLEEARALLAEKGVDLAILEDIEDDAFGNGGLGRLAACFLDSAVTCGVRIKPSETAAAAASAEGGGTSVNSSAAPSRTESTFERMEILCRII